MAEEFKPQYSFTDDRLNELKQLFPEAWEDGVFNMDTLRSLIGDYSTDNNVKEHFGLNWVGKQDARKIASKPPTGTLKPAPGEGVNEDDTENIFIEGDNLEVLKILRKSYMGKIKMIYIDPPYNTGNDFIYNDSFGDSTEDYLRKSGDKSEEGLLVSNPKTSGKYHANWLTFMYPRLRLAKDLLSNKGVIFISIDDNEVENLRSLSNEILGKENFVTSFIWRRRKTQANLAKFVAPVHDYILCYAKDISQLELNRIPFPKEYIEKSFKNPDNDQRGVYQTGPLARPANSSNREYELEMPNGRKIVAKWSCSQSTFNELVRDNRLVIPRGGEGMPRKKIFLSELEGLLPNTWLDKIASNDDAAGEIEELFGSNAYFSYPKPTKLLEFLIQLGSNENDIVLDFFAGSGTTAHSIFNLNFQGNSNRKFILVQLDENLDSKTVAFKNGYTKLTEISRERIKKVLDKYMSTKGFKSFHLSRSNFYSWKNFESHKDGLLPDLFSKLEAAFKNPLVEGTTPEEFITEVMLQEGFPLTANQTEVQDGIFKISHDWVPYTLYVSMLQSFKNIDLEALGLSETDHFVCLDMAFENNDALKQTLDNHCKLFTV